MKFSKYNVFVNGQEARMLLNTISLNMVPMTKELEKSIEKCNPDILPHEQLSVLIDGAFVVDNDVDEICAIENRFNKEKQEPIMMIKYLLSTGCNSDCLYCYQHYAHFNGMTTDAEKIRTFFVWIDGYIQKNRIEKVVIELFGGEPLLAAKHLPLFFALLNNLKEKYTCKDFSVSIITNASLLTTDILNLLVENEVEFKFSIDGPQNVHDQRRPLKTGISSYERTIDAIHNIKELGRIDLVSIRYNLDKNNIDYLEDVAHRMQELGVKRVYCGKIFFRGKETPYTPNIIDELQYYQDGTCAKLYGILSKYGYSDTPCAITDFEVCQFYRLHSYVLSPKLEVAKCDEILDSKEQQVGYINENAELILVGDNYKLQTGCSPMKDAECKECAYLPICGMGCPAQAMNLTGSPLNHSCMNKEILQEKINVLLSIMG
jgi:uncharacterized protein